MRTIPIQANLRERVGKGSARSSRREGMLPGVLYGQGENVAISIDRKEFANAMHEAHGENVIWDVAVDGPIDDTAQHATRVSLEAAERGLPITIKSFLYVPVNSMDFQDCLFGVNIVATRLEKKETDDLLFTLRTCFQSI